VPIDNDEDRKMDVRAGGYMAIQVTGWKRMV
jgi:hypothetical protein